MPITASLVLTLASALSSSMAVAATDPPPVGPSITLPHPSSAVWPLEPAEVVAGFDPASTPWAPAHRGVDLAGRPGQPVRAALDGTVTYAAQLAGRGVVVISHGETRTTYEPVTAAVDVGDLVRAGDPIGHLEAGAGHCLPLACLHWGLRAGDDYLDPRSLLGAAAVRLLPLMPAGEPAGTRSEDARW